MKNTLPMEPSLQCNLDYIYWYECLPYCMYVLWRPGEGVGFSASGVTDLRELHACKGNWTWEVTQCKPNPNSKNFVVELPPFPFLWAVDAALPEEWSLPLLPSWKLSTGPFSTLCIVPLHYCYEMELSSSFYLRVSPCSLVFSSSFLNNLESESFRIFKNSEDKREIPIHQGVKGNWFFPSSWPLSFSKFKLEQAHAPVSFSTSSNQRTHVSLTHG